MNQSPETQEERLANVGHLMEVLNEKVASVAVENQILKAELCAIRSMIWACLATSPEALAFVESERPSFRASLAPFNLHPLQIEHAVDMMERQLLSAQQHRRGLPGFVRHMWHESLSMLERATNPCRWTRRGGAMALGGLAIAWLFFAWAS